MQINSFEGEYGFLSNFYECSVEYNGMTFGSSEAAFQAQKCVDDEDKIKFKYLRPKGAKRFGKTVKLRPDWDEVKVEVMRGVLKAKFTQNPELKSMLLATGDNELVEGNRWGDRFWGVCKGTGQNNLGKLLMELRDDLRDAKSDDSTPSAVFSSMS